jgi:peptide/nickel transport system permease protein
MTSRQRIYLTLAFLGAVHASVLLASFLGPYQAEAQARELPFTPPTWPHFVDTRGRLHLRPFIYACAPGSVLAEPCAEDRRRSFPLRFFVRDSSAGLEVERESLADQGAGLPSSESGRGHWRMLGVDQPGRIFLLGSDGLGRDQFSRLLHGGQVSLFAGILAAGLALGFGLVLGAVAGFCGGWVDHLVMRSAELFLALPWLYLLFAVRAFLPLHLSPIHSFLLLIAVMGLVGWARPARLIRAVVLSARERDYVAAARGFGASDMHLLRRHVLPQAFGVVMTQAGILIPQFILAEVALSYLGLGVAEPVPSLGNLLAELQQYHVLASYWWMFLPGVALIPVFAGYYALANALQERAGVVPT